MAEQQKTQTVQMDLGLPGMPEYLITVFGKDNVPLGPPAGSPGLYRGLLTITREGFRPIGEYEVTSGKNIRGDSHLKMAKPAYEPPGNPDADELRMDLTTDRGERFLVVGKPNDRGFLAKVEVRDFEAAGFSEAFEKASRAASVMLTNLSVHLDMPLRVFQTDIHEVATNSHWMAVINPHFEIPPLIDTAMSGSAEFRAYGSLYREALSSNSLLYAFLCFYKITEGIRKKRVAKEREARKQGSAYSPPMEVLPRDEADFIPWLNSLYPVVPKWRDYHLEAIFRADAVGRAFLDLLGDGTEITNLRNDIGHAFTASSGKDVTNLDDRNFHTRVNTWLPLLKCMARRMMRNEFPKEFLPWLNDPFKGR